MQEDEFRRAVEVAGFTIERVQANPSCRLISDNAQAASRRHGAKGIFAPAMRC